MQWVPNQPVLQSKTRERERRGGEREGNREGKRVTKEIINDQETINTVRITMFEQTSGKLLWQLDGDKGRQISKAKMQTTKQILY